MNGPEVQLQKPQSGQARGLQAAVHCGASIVRYPSFSEERGADTGLAPEAVLSPGPALQSPREVPRGGQPSHLLPRM